MIFKTEYKDRPAIGINTGILNALFLPEDGGKLASLKAVRDGYEFLAQAPGETYKRLACDGSYADSECSAFDDMFPTIDPYLNYPDHGEICRLELDCELTGESINLRVSSRLFPITYKKIIKASDGNLVIRHVINNHGKDFFPCIWAAHCMLNINKGAEIITPYPPDSPVKYMFGSDGEKTFKYYFTQPISEGYCGYKYNSRNESLMLRYDSGILPWLGIWVNNGGFKDMHNIALEPCSAPYDLPDLSYSVLPPESELDFNIIISLERII